MKYDIFENEKEKHDAITHLTRLRDDPAWKIILKVLESNKAFLEDQIKDMAEKRGFENLEEFYLIEDQIDHFNELQRLPDTLILTAQPDPEEEDDSIYE
jgi:hypothetical protein